MGFFSDLGSALLNGATNTVVEMNQSGDTWKQKYSQMTDSALKRECENIKYEIEEMRRTSNLKAIKELGPKKAALSQVCSERNVYISWE